MVALVPILPSCRRAGAGGDNADGELVLIPARERPLPACVHAHLRHELTKAVAGHSTTLSLYYSACEHLGVHDGRSRQRTDSGSESGAIQSPYGDPRGERRLVYEIGRASCRERGEISVGAVSFQTT